MHKAKNIYFFLKKKNEMAQGRGWPKAGYLRLIGIGHRKLLREMTKRKSCKTIIMYKRIYIERLLPKFFLEYLF